MIKYHSHKTCTIYSWFAIAIICVGLNNGLASNSLLAKQQPNNLLWLNGDELPGTPVGVNGKNIQWKSGLFETPVEIDSRVLKQLSFSFADGMNQNLEPFAITTRAGARFFGKLASINDKFVVLSSKRFGEVSFKRNHVSEIVNMTNSQTIMDGIRDLNEWRGLNGTWFADETGAITTLVPNSFISKPLELPDVVRVDFEVEWKKKLDFTISFGAIGTVGALEKTNRIETWDDSLVVIDADGEFESIFTSIEESNEAGVNKLRLVVILDSAKEILRVFDSDGNLLCTKPISIQKRKQIREGFTFVNKEGDLKLNRFRVSQCGANYVPSDKPIQLADGSSLAGIIKAFDGSWTIADGDKTTNIAINQLSAAFFRGSESSPPDSTGSSNGIPKTIIQFFDGSFAKGTLKELSETEATFTFDFADSPVSFDLSGANKISFTDKLINHSTPQTHLLETGGKSLRGRMVSKNDRPHWLAVGSQVESPIVCDDIRISSLGTRNESQSIKVTTDDRLPDTLFFNNGDSVRCSIRKIDENHISFAAPFEGGIVPRETIKAIAFSCRNETKPISPEDPLWFAPQSNKGEIERLENGFKLNPGNVLAHPALLESGDFQFDITCEKGGPIRLFVSLFVNQADGFGEHLSFALDVKDQLIKLGSLNFGGSLGACQMTFNGDQAFAKIRIKVIDKILHIIINGKTYKKLPIDPRLLKATGVTFNQLKFGDAGNLVLSNFLTANLRVPLAIFNQDKKARALTIPRLQKNDPPKHILCSKQGDLLRGHLVSLDLETVKFRSKLDEFRFSRDKIDSIVWLNLPAKTDSSKITTSKTGPAKSKKPNNDKGRSVQVVCKNGQRLTFQVEKWNDKIIEGVSSLLGRIKIFCSEVEEIRTGLIATEATDSPFASWVAKYAKEVQLETSAHDDSELIGTQAANFSATDSSQTNLQLSDFRGKVVVLDFWATWCGPCVKSLPGLAEMINEMDSKDIVFLPVNQGESRQQVSDFLANRGLDFASVLDPDSEIGRSFGVSSIPQTVVIDQDGKIAFLQVGANANLKESLRSKIQELLEKAN